MIMRLADRLEESRDEPRPGQQTQTGCEANERAGQARLLDDERNAFAIGIVGAAVIVPGVSSPASLLEPQRVI
jgi:hypothetical protein